MKVSVLIITYNHERFIRQALDSVLSQQVDFDYEVVIGEDCSTDRTRDILLEYQSRHPDKIRLLLRDSNLGAVTNFFSTLQACRGQYIALLEGDDYWTANDKLRTQVNFLDARPDFVICFHDVRGVHENHSAPDFPYVPRNLKPVLRLDDLLAENIIPTGSVLFRNGLLPRYPEWMLELRMADYPLHILNAQHGKIGYINQVMGVYRVHDAGVWSGMNRAERLSMVASMFKFLLREVMPMHRPAIRDALARRYWQLTLEQEAMKDPASARRSLIRSLRTKPFTGSPSMRHKLRVLTRLSIPSVYRPLAKIYRRVHPKVLA